MRKVKFLLLLIALLSLSSCNGNKKDYGQYLTNEEATLSMEDIDWAMDDTLLPLTSDERMEIMAGRVTYGEYYKAGLMGHRHVVKFGNKFSLFTFISKKDKDVYDTHYYVTFPKEVHDFETSLNIPQVMLSQKVSVGEFGLIENEIKNTFSYDTKGTKLMSGSEECLGNIKTYYMKDNSSYRDASCGGVLTFDDKNERFFIEGKQNACWSEIWACLDFEIEESYVEEETLFGWKKLSGTVHENYVGRFVLDVTHTVSYSDGTAGFYRSDTDTNYEFKLGTVKSWDFSNK